MSEVKRITAQEIASGTPPTAETREAREWWVYIGELYDTEQEARNEAIMDRCDPNEVFAVRKVTHPEPQAPRVSEGALRRLVEDTQQLEADGLQEDADYYREILAALSQPAQGEGKTEAEDELIDTVVDLAPTGLNCRAVAKAIAAVVAERANGREQSPT